MAIINQNEAAAAASATKSDVFGSVFVNVDWVNPDDSKKRVGGINLMPEKKQYQTEFHRKLLAVLEEHGADFVNQHGKFEVTINVTAPATEAVITEAGGIQI